MRTRVSLLSQGVAIVVTEPRWFEFWATGEERRALFIPGDGWYYDYGGKRVELSVVQLIEKQVAFAPPGPLVTDDDIAIARRIASLGPDVRACYDELITKAEGGHAKYGKLTLVTDSRDFEAEARMELLDLVHYLGYRVVQLKRENSRLAARNAAVESMLAEGAVR